MIWNSGWRLASAVSNSGGLGLLGAGSMYPEILREHILKCKKATEKPFGVNVPMLYPDIDKIIDIIIEEGVKIVFTSAGNPKDIYFKIKGKRHYGRSRCKQCKIRIKGPRSRCGCRCC